MEFQDGKESRVIFQRELDAIKTDIIRLAAMVTETIPRGTEVLLTGNLRLAEEVIQGDDRIDALSIEIEEHCHSVLALQNPVAGDLRAVLTAIKLISEIERSGDLMVNIVKGARRIYGQQFDPTLRGFVQRMAELSQRLFQLSIDAYDEGDAGLAAALDDIDDQLDDVHADYIQAIFESHNSGFVEVPAAVQLAVVGRFYERIGDHAVNIGERVHYQVTGWMPAHHGATRRDARERVQVSRDDDVGDDGTPAEEHADTP